MLSTIMVLSLILRSTEPSVAFFRDHRWPGGRWRNCAEVCRDCAGKQKLSPGGIINNNHFPDTPRRIVRQANNKKHKISYYSLPVAFYTIFSL